MKFHLMAVSALAILAAAPASAFDTINWNWDADVQTNIAVDANSNIDVNPSGLEMVEGDQTLTGNLTANSTLSSIDNDISSIDPVSLDDILATESQGSAIGNNASLASDVAVNYDLNQVYGGLDTTFADPLLGTSTSVPLPGIITASASTAEISNATVDNDATGVANNISVDLAAGSPDDGFLVGNSTQTAMADIDTLSTVGSVSFSGVSGLGTLADPGISSAATSVGNNLDVAVSSVDPIQP